MIRLERPPTLPAYFASAEVERLRAGVRDFSCAEKTRCRERPDFPLFPRDSYTVILEFIKRGQPYCAMARQIARAELPGLNMPD